LGGAPDDNHAAAREQSLTASVSFAGVGWRRRGKRTPLRARAGHLLVSHAQPGGDKINVGAAAEATVARRQNDLQTVCNLWAGGALSAAPQLRRRASARTP
jgi:hypothetical protein